MVVITNLPVPGLTLQNHGVFNVTEVIFLGLLDILNFLLSHNSVILRECTVVTLLYEAKTMSKKKQLARQSDDAWGGSQETYATGMSKEMRANRLDVALVSGGQGADGLEVLFGLPASG